MPLTPQLQQLFHSKHTHTHSIETCLTLKVFQLITYSTFVLCRTGCSKMSGVVVPGVLVGYQRPWLGFSTAFKLPLCTFLLWGKAWWDIKGSCIHLLTKGKFDDGLERRKDRLRMVLFYDTHCCWICKSHSPAAPTANPDFLPCHFQVFYISSMQLNPKGSSKGSRVIFISSLHSWFSAAFFLLILLLRI